MKGRQSLTGSSPPTEGKSDHGLGLHWPNDIAEFTDGFTKAQTLDGLCIYYAGRGLKHRERGARR